MAGFKQQVETKLVKTKQNKTKQNISTTKICVFRVYVVRGSRNEKPLALLHLPHCSILILSIPYTYIHTHTRKMAAYAGNSQMMQIVVPQGCRPGQLLQVQTPTGQMVKWRYRQDSSQGWPSTFRSMVDRVSRQGASPAARPGSGQPLLRCRCR